MRMPRGGLTPVAKGGGNFKSSRFPRHECNEMCYNVEDLSLGMLSSEQKAD
jgi:hypothetical protein